MPEIYIFDYRVYTPLYEKGIKQNQNKSMETTITKEGSVVGDQLYYIRRLFDIF